ncbi:MAG: SDR family oxidoreductase [Chloroflexota bacterium]
MLKVLFIGGTGVISSECSAYAVSNGVDLTILNRSVSKKHQIPAGARQILGDIQKEAPDLLSRLNQQHFDVVVDWIAFTPQDIERDLRLFRGKTGQFIFISSASAYQKPPANYLITEQTPLENPFWQYSRDKIACEQLLMDEYQKNDFPVTIIRPSLTYGYSQIPLIFGSWNYPYTVIDRIKKEKKIIVPGDGTSLWSLTWSGDLARGLTGLFGRKDTLGEAFHITTDEVLTWNQIYADLGKALGVEPEIVHIASDLLAAYTDRAVGSLIGDKANSVVFDNSKIKKYVPGFKCEVSWAQGVKRAIDWHEASPERMEIDPELNQLWDRIITGYEKAFPA